MQVDHSPGNEGISQKSGEMKKVRMVRGSQGIRVKSGKSGNLNRLSKHKSFTLPFLRFNPMISVSIKCHTLRTRPGKIPCGEKNPGKIRKIQGGRKSKGGGHSG